MFFLVFWLQKRVGPMWPTLWELGLILASGGGGRIYATARYVFLNKLTPVRVLRNSFLSEHYFNDFDVLPKNKHSDMAPDERKGRYFVF